MKKPKEGTDWQGPIVGRRGLIAGALALVVGSKFDLGAKLLGGTVEVLSNGRAVFIKETLRQALKMPLVKTSISEHGIGFKPLLGMIGRQYDLATTQKELLLAGHSKVAHLLQSMDVPLEISRKGISFANNFTKAIEGLSSRGPNFLKSEEFVRAPFCHYELRLPPQLNVSVPFSEGHTLDIMNRTSIGPNGIVSDNFCYVVKDGGSCLCDINLEKLIPGEDPLEQFLHCLNNPDQVLNEEVLKDVQRQFEKAMAQKQKQQEVEKGKSFPGWQELQASTALTPVDQVFKQVSDKIEDRCSPTVLCPEDWKNSIMIDAQETVHALLNSSQLSLNQI